MHHVKESEPQVREPRSSRGIVDCDVHNAPRSIGDLLPYMPKRWVSYVETTSYGALPGTKTMYPAIVGKQGTRHDVQPADGSPAGSDRDMVGDHLDEHGISTAILTGTFHNLPFMPNIDFAEAFASAANDWLIEHWLSYDARFKGSMILPLQSVAGAVAEIERVGSHPDIVQALVPCASGTPYGQRLYHPVWEACERHGLVVGMHLGGAGIVWPPTPVGWPSFYMEWHTAGSLPFQAHLVSLVCEGVFVRYPKLRFAFIEGGLAWLPHILWRLDKNWKALRSEVPWLTERPSRAVLDHFRFTTQPIEEPDDPGQLLQILDMMEADRTVLFASDYPHWDFDSPARALPKMPDELRARILGDSARELYGLA